MGGGCHTPPNVRPSVQSSGSLGMCVIKRELASDEHMKYYFEHYVTDPLETCDALYAGRTNAAKLYHECEEGKKIR